MLSTQEIRAKFLDFYAENQHAKVKSSSLIPGNDPTLLFVNAGMVQFKDVFLGAEKRNYTRATSSQRCVRAGGKHNDLDQVGYTARHHTFFEMLGNFSFGDYFKKEAIQMAWDFLTKELGLPVEKLWVTVFEEDDEAEKIWLNDMGFPKSRLSRIGAKDNFWQMGDTGPCGPCTEIFYDHGEDIAGGPPGTPEEDGDRYIEIWNLVFMQYDRQADGTLAPLPKPCVDTGMGLERIASIMQGKHNNYDIDLFQHLIKKAVALTGARDTKDPSLKVIADHIRTCAFLIADGVLPSNEGRGYVLRRIIRRAARHGHKLGAQSLFFYHMVPALIDVMGEDYPELVEQRDVIMAALKKEEQKFAETLGLGMQEFNKMTQKLKANEPVSGAVAFKLYDTYGFPLDLTQDVARESGRAVDVSGFESLMEAQKVRSRSSKQFTQANQLSAEIIKTLPVTQFLGYDRSESNAEVVAIIQEGSLVESVGAGSHAIVILDATPMYAESGGQVGDKGVITNDSGVHVVVSDTQKAANQFHLHHAEVKSGGLSKGDQVKVQVDQSYRNDVILNHSATHLLHKVLRDILGKHVQQKGSLVNAEKLRFDFSHDQAIDSETLQQVERKVNDAIRANYSAEANVMAFDEAVESGAMALFGEKYGDDVRVMDFGGYSVELCGGTHVKATGDIGLFKIIEETAVASGIRRIEAVTGSTALSLIQENERQLRLLAHTLKAQPGQITQSLMQLIDKNKSLQVEIDSIKQSQANAAVKNVFDSVKVVGDVHFLSHVFENTEVGVLRDHIDGFKGKFEKGIVVFANVKEGKAQILVGVTDAMTQVHKAGAIIKDVLAPLGGRGGGRPDFAQGGGDGDVKTLEASIAKVLNTLQQK
ncbi:alanine--tRNA ligase [Marinicella rhabdoformis]|uniref:alanine--tRNA ligase n=1 Tax=Marinicella rhabdoformis TaxID=2580566 RepID=UPI0012AEB6B3|nr:alanine--tRNA ligase [Marinicella rhabdoformis]